MTKKIQRKTKAKTTLLRVMTNAESRACIKGFVRAESEKDAETGEAMEKVSTLWIIKLSNLSATQVDELPIFEYLKYENELAGMVEAIAKPVPKK